MSGEVPVAWTRDLQRARTPGLRPGDSLKRRRPWNQDLGAKHSSGSRTVLPGRGNSLRKGSKVGTHRPQPRGEPLGALLGPWDPGAQGGGAGAGGSADQAGPPHLGATRAGSGPGSVTGRRAGGQEGARTSHALTEPRPAGFREEALFPTVTKEPRRPRGGRPGITPPGPREARGGGGGGGRSPPTHQDPRPSQDSKPGEAGGDLTHLPSASRPHRAVVWLPGPGRVLGPRTFWNQLPPKPPLPGKHFLWGESPHPPGPSFPAHPRALLLSRHPHPAPEPETPLPARR